MVAKFPEIFNVEFTSGMENELDRIEDGELGWQRVLNEFYGPFMQGARRGGHERRSWPMRTGSIRKTWPRSAAPSAASAIELKTGRFGPYLACVKYKDTCDYVKSLRKARAPDRPTDEKCQLCGSPMVIKTGRFGEFLACTTYPACKGTRAIPLGIKCPKCLEGDIAERRTKRGKSFWGCVPLPGVRLLHLEPPGGGDLPRVRLGRDGEEGEQGRRGDPHLPQVQATRSFSPSPRRWPWRDRHRRRRRARRLGGGLGARRTRRPGDPVRDAAGGADARAPHRPPRRAGLQQLLQVGGPRPTRTGCSRPSCARSAACCCPAPTRRGCRAARRSRWTGRSSPARCTTG